MSFALDKDHFDGGKHIVGDHPLSLVTLLNKFKASLNAQQEVVQFNHRLETLGTMVGGAAGGVGVECWVMITDSDGTPDLAADDASIDVTVSGDGRIDGQATSKSVQIVGGVAKFVVTKATSGVATIGLAGSPPVNNAFGSALDITDTQTVTFT